MKPGHRFTSYMEDAEGHVVRKCRVFVPPDVNANELTEAYLDFMRACGYAETTVAKVKEELEELEK